MNYNSREGKELGIESLKCPYQRRALSIATTLTAEEMGSGDYSPWIVLGPRQESAGWHPWGISAISLLRCDLLGHSLLGKFSGVGVWVLTGSGHVASKRKRGLVSEGRIAHVLYLGFLARCHADQTHPRVCDWNLWQEPILLLWGTRNKRTLRARSCINSGN